MKGVMMTKDIDENTLGLSEKEKAFLKAEEERMGMKLKELLFTICASPADRRIRSGCTFISLPSLTDAFPFSRPEENTRATMTACTAGSS